MKKILIKIHNNLVNYGFDLLKFIHAINPNNTKWFAEDYSELKRQKGSDNTFVFGQVRAMLGDRVEAAGIIDGAYFHQDLYVANKIYNSNPKIHLDIGSRIDGFVAHVASFRIIEIIDIRNLKSTIKNIVFRQADLMQLPNELINYCDSISSLHAIEHFGLGRYGDPIDYFGYLKAINNITQILKSGGSFYFSVPIGPQRIEFNAHRVFSVKYLLETLSPMYIIKEFAYIDDKGVLYENTTLSDEGIDSNFGCQYGCGVFILTKR